MNFVPLDSNRVKKVNPFSAVVALAMTGIPPNLLHPVNGVLVPEYIVQENVDKMKNMELYPDDVWIVTYPKCGTTWTQQIVRLIRNKGQQDDMKVTDAVPWPEAAARFPVDIDSLSRPRTLKSHLPYHALPCGPPHTTPCKYIFVMRNPKDVAVSMYFHLKKEMKERNEWNDFWKLFVSMKVNGSYFDEHILAWWEHRNDKNVLILKYEDMKRNLVEAVCKIAEFMEVELSEDIAAKIAELTTFKNMKKDDTANMTWREAFRDNTFLRKGEIGDWKNYLTPEQSAEIDALCTEKLKHTNIKFDFE